MGSIIFDQILPQYTPDTQIETDWTSNLNGLPSTTRRLMCVGYKTSAGTATVHVAYKVSSITRAKELFGEGSHVAVMIAAALDVNPRIPIYGCCFAEDGGAVAASGEIEYASTATGSGTTVVHVAGDRYEIGISSGDSADDIGSALESAINAAENKPYTASNSSGTVTITARNACPEGNDFGLRGEITSGITTTISVTGFASGATAGDPTAMYTALEGDRYHVIVSGTNDSTAAGLLKDHAEKQSGPDVQKWCMGIVGSVDTDANTQTLANGFDSYRMQTLWSEENEKPTFELAARFGALRCGTDIRLSLDDVELPGVASPDDRSKWPTAAEIETALEEGIVPLRPTDNGKCYVVRSVVTRQTAPIVFRDSNVAEISDYTDESIIYRFKNQFQGRPLKNASKPGTKRTVTPSIAKAILASVLTNLDNNDYLQGVEDAIEAGQVNAEINDTDSNRVDTAFPFQPINHAHFIAMRKSYVI